MKKLLVLKFLAGLFGCIWICAAIASVYFLYKASINEASISYLLGSIGAGFIARYLAATIGSGKERVDYVHQLMEHGYTRLAAASAWELANNGGLNLLLNLQQLETIAETNLRKIRSDRSIGREMGHFNETNYSVD